MRSHRRHTCPIYCWNSYVSEMQLWFVTVSSNELDQSPIWHTRRLGAVHDTNGLASYLITYKSYDDTDGTLTDFEWRRKTELRLLLSTLIVLYKWCGNEVVFKAFRYVALALALGVVVLLTSLVVGQCSSCEPCRRPLTSAVSAIAEILARRWMNVK